MGNWNINIQGIGSHHNKNLDDDANRMAARFVKALLDAGHKVEHATFTHGGKEDTTLTPEANGIPYVPTG